MLRVNSIESKNMNDQTFGPLPGDDSVTEYISKHRNPNLPALDISAPLDLFPSLPLPPGITPRFTWADNWPFSERAGVYFVYSESFDLLYIGKSSNNQCLGKRLYCWFGGGDTCVPVGTWSQPPRFVVTIAVPDESPFEAPSLEEYLVRKLQPPDNTHGK